MTQEREVAAVVAHGLLNTLSVITGSASMLTTLDDRLTAADRAALTQSLASNIQLFGDVFATGLGESSSALADRVTRMVEAGGALAGGSSPERTVMLNAILDAAATLFDGLTSLVRGLSPETLAVLDELRPDGIGADPRTSLRVLGR